MTCSARGCVRRLHAHGLCEAHYQRRRAGTDLDKPLQEAQTGPCSVEGCQRPKRARGYCSAHYRRLLVGNVNESDPIGKHWRPDNPHRRKIGTTYPTSDGYVRVWDPQHANAAADGWVLQHRHVMAAALGRALFADELVHHKDGVRDNNALENLELCVRRQPPGQRVEDVLEWAREIVARYDHVHVGIAA